ncbi:MAG: hypothetical protein K2G62_03840, partial [Oscillospiraceae bacterium]|nr:hypothetical protein [Oscillospiraceae bacterium]
MKEKELYRIIDNLKPDSCLKNRICNAVESKDFIRSERKPVFIPVVMMLLICVNLGAMTLFFTGDKFNSKWSEAGESSFEQDNIEKIGITMKDQIDSFLQEISQNDYDWFDVQNYHVNLPYGTSPWYSMGIYDLDLRFNTDYTYSEDPDDTIRYRKYVQKVPVEFTGYNGSPVYTNHEYLVCYDEKGKENENIVYVLESSFDLTKGDFFKGKSYKELLDVWYDQLDEYGLNLMFFTSENSFTLLNNTLIESYNSDGSVNGGDQEWVKICDIGNGKGVEPYSEEFLYPPNNWQIPEELTDNIIPDISNMILPDAYNILKEYSINYKVSTPAEFDNVNGSDYDLIVTSVYPMDIVSKDETVIVYT